MAKKSYTAKQGQYLAYIFYYTKMHGVAPAELDMQSYFGVTPPSVHDMVLRLEAEGFIERVPGKGRSIRLLIPREELPNLESRLPREISSYRSLNMGTTALDQRPSCPAAEHPYVAGMGAVDGIHQ
jgi:repressor LexA